MLYIIIKQRVRFEINLSIVWFESYKKDRRYDVNFVKKKKKIRC